MTTDTKGWECPRCGRCYAPFKLECHWCGPRTAQFVYVDSPFESRQFCVICQCEAMVTINGLCSTCHGKGGTIS